MASALPWVVGGLGGVAKAFGASKPKTSTSTTESRGTQTAELDPKQRKVNKALFRQILDAIRQGPTVSQSDRNTARGQINDSYDAGAERLTSNLAARGFGNSGKMGAGFRDMEIDRQNAFQTTEAGLRGEAQNRFMQMLQAAFQFNSPRTFSQESQSTTQGSMSGTPFMSSLGGGLSDLSSLLFLKNMGGFAGSPGFCWISEELYGAHDWRVTLLRSHLVGRARESRLAAVGLLLYAATGKLVARIIRRSQTARRACKQLFDRMVADALAA